MTKAKKSRFKENESNMHRCAKEVLMSWLKDDYLKIVPEGKFMMKGSIWFVPDLTCYTDEGIKDLYEVVYKHDLTAWKIWKMQNYFHVHNWDVNVYTVEALWIMNQTNKPASLQYRQILNDKDFRINN